MGRATRWRTGIRPAVAALVAAAFAAAPGTAPGSAGTAPSREAAHPAPTRPSFVPSVPALLLENDGHAPAATRFVGRAGGCTAAFDGEGVLLVAPAPRGGAWAVRMAPEAAPPLRWTPCDGAAPGPLASFRGARPGAWRSRLPLLAGVATADAFPGARLRWRGEGDALTWDLDLAPGAPADALAFRFEGATAVTVTGSGALRVEAGDGAFLHSRPVAWQEGPEGRRAVEARWLPGPGPRARIDLGPADPSLPLSIDPRVDYASAFGYAGREELTTRVAVDPAGNWLLAVRILDVVPPGPHVDVDSDVLVVKLDPTGGTVLFAVEVGSALQEDVAAVAADAAGRVYVAGTSAAPRDFPQVNPLAAQGAGRDGYVVALAADGQSIVYATPYGGDGGQIGFEGILGMAVTPAGAAVVVGESDATDLPVLGPGAREAGGGADGFVARIAPGGGTLEFATHLGGYLQDRAVGVALLAGGAVAVAGTTSSPDFPVAGAVQPALSGPQDGFLVLLAADGAPGRATYVGGTDWDGGTAVAEDDDGTVLWAGWTESPGFPAPGDPVAPEGARDMLFARYAADGSARLLALRHGGSGDDEPARIAPDGAGGFVVGGWTTSPDFPLFDGVAGAPAPSASDTGAAFVRVLGNGAVRSSSLVVGKSTSALHVATAGPGLFLAGTTTTATPPVVDASPPLPGPPYGALLVLADGPTRPANPAAVPVAPGSVDLSWDASPGAWSYDVEVRAPGGAFAAAGSPTASPFEHRNLLPGSTRTYRVRARNAGGVSRWTAETTATTGPASAAPAAPGEVVAAVLSGGAEVEVAWSDGSDDEVAFRVERSTDGVAWTSAGIVGVGATAWRGPAPVADRTGRFRVRAENAAGASAWAGPAEARAPGNLSLVVAKGSIAAKRGLGRVKLAGVLAPATAPADLIAGGFELRVGGWEGPVVAAAFPAHPLWKEKRGRLQWTSARGFAPKARFLYDPATGAFTLKASKVAMAATPSNPVEVSFGDGDSGGSHLAAWVESRKGLRYAEP